MSRTRLSRSAWHVTRKRACRPPSAFLDFGYEAFTASQRKTPQDLEARSNWRDLVSRLARNSILALGLFGLGTTVGAQSLAQPGWSTAANSPGWISDQRTGCRVWSPAPEPNDTVTWSGPCVNGLAENAGVAEWLKEGILSKRVEGRFSAGRPTDTVKVTLPIGITYIGKISDQGDQSDREGQYIFLSGTRYKGMVANGIPQGPGEWTFSRAPSEIQDLPELLFISASLLSQGRYAEVETFQRRAAAVAENFFGANHPSVAISLQLLTVTLIKRGSYREAESIQKRILLIWGLGPDSLGTAVSWVGLGEIYLKLGDHKEAKSFYRKAVDFHEHSGGINSPAGVSALSGLGAVYAAQADYAAAEGLYQRAISAAEAGRISDFHVIPTLHESLAVLYHSQGQYSQSELHHRIAISKIEKYLGVDHINVSAPINGLANLYWALGKYNEAESLSKHAIRIQESVLGLNHPDLAASLNTLSLIYNSEYRYSESLDLARRSLLILENSLGRDHSDIAPVLNNMALTLRSLRRFEEAEGHYKRALIISEKALGADHPDLIPALNNLALAYTDQGRKIEAGLLYQRAMSIAEKTLGQTHQTYALLLTNLAILYAAEGRVSESEQYFIRALKIKEEILEPSHPSIINSLDNIAQFYNNQGRHEDTIPLIRKMEQVSATPPISSLLMLSNSRRGAQISSTESLFLSLSILQKNGASAASEAVNKLAQRFTTGVGERADLIRRDQDLANQWAAMDKLLTAEFSKRPEQRNKEAEANIRARIDAIVAERKEIAETLAKRFPDYVALTKPPVLQIADIQAVLEDDEALVAIEPGENSFAWVITRTTADWTAIPVSAATLNEEVQALREGLAAGPDGKTQKPFDTALAFKVYQQTLGPIANMIAGKKRLSVYLGGALTSIPLQVLVTADPTGKKYADVAWLTKSFAITNLPSIYSLKAMRRQLPPSRATKPMVAFADPVFSRNARVQIQAALTRGLPEFYQGTTLDLTKLGEELRQLPGTRREVREVGSTLKADPKDQFFGEAASVSAVRQAKLDQYRVVYFATHALVAGDLAKYAKARAEPALALSFPQTPTQDDNGLLPASEVAQLKLDADWVVLSACNTAAGNTPGAEALSGLARAFIYAGARSLLVSHWPVDDAATAKLMTRLFQIGRDNPGMSHGEMLQAANLRLLETARTNDDAHPRLWAPFVVVGEPQKPLQVTGTRR